MSSLVALLVEGSDPVLVEVDDAAGGIVRAGRAAELVESLGETFQASLARLRPLADALREQFDALTERPDEVGVEFGLKVTADAGVVIAHTSGEANFKVTLQWRRHQM